jgi:hypothetical protein
MATCIVKLGHHDPDKLVVGELYTIYNPIGKVWNYTLTGEVSMCCLYLGKQDVKLKTIVNGLYEVNAYVFHNIETNQQCFLEYPDFVNGFYCEKI